MGIVHRDLVESQQFPNGLDNGTWKRWIKCSCLDPDTEYSTIAYSFQVEGNNHQTEKAKEVKWKVPWISSVAVWETVWKE